MTTLAEMTLMVARIVGEVVTGTATGASATSLTDTGMSQEDYPDGYWDGGTIWILTGDYAGCSAVITSWTAGTSVFTFPTPDTAVITPEFAVGDTYAVEHKQFTRKALINAVNQALTEAGKMVKKNATLTGNGGSLTLPTGVSDARRVLADSAHNYYWNEVNGVLDFADGQEPAAGDAIVIYYMGRHALVAGDFDAISGIDESRLAWTAAACALRDAMKASGTDKAALNPRYQEAIARSEQLKSLYPNRGLARDPHLSGY